MSQSQFAAFPKIKAFLEWGSRDKSKTCQPLRTLRGDFLIAWPFPCIYSRGCKTPENSYVSNSTFLPVKNHCHALEAMIGSPVTV